MPEVRPLDDSSIHLLRRQGHLLRRASRRPLSGVQLRDAIGRNR